MRKSKEEPVRCYWLRVRGLQVLSAGFRVSGVNKPYNERPDTASCPCTREPWLPVFQPGSLEEECSATNVIRVQPPSS